MEAAQLFRLRHSLAHVMAQAVRDYFQKEGPVLQIAAGKVSLRSRDQEGRRSLSVEELIAELQEEIQNKTMK